nr:hypothetical protein CFP56_42235 [Quercus suber]
MEYRLLCGPICFTQALSSGERHLEVIDGAAMPSSHQPSLERVAQANNIKGHTSTEQTSYSLGESKDRRASNSSAHSIFNQLKSADGSRQRTASPDTMSGLGVALECIVWYDSTNVVKQESFRNRHTILRDLFGPLPPGLPEFHTKSLY